VEQERERSAREQQNESEENDRSGFHQSNHEKSGATNTSAVTTVTQQDISLNEYLSRFSGPPTFPVSFQPMYKYPGELVQIQTQTQEDQNLMTDHSSSVMTPEQPQVCKMPVL